MLHTLTLTNQTLGEAGPGPVRWALSQKPIEMPGGTDAVNAMNWNAERGYAVGVGALDADGRRSRRPRRVDVGQPDRPVGATRSPGTTPTRRPHGPRGGSFPWPFTPGAVEAAAVDRLDLRPAPPGND